MTDETMVERVARAISKLSYGMTGEPMVDWEDAEGMARAAIEAMRDYLAGDLPENILDAYGEAEGANDHPAEYHFNARRFSAMIDAALKDGSRDAS